MRLPKNIIKHLQPEIDKIISELIAECKMDYDFRFIEGYITDTRRGRAYFGSHFTVPLWAFDKRHPGYRSEMGYFKYYVAHELSHIIQYRINNTHGHGKSFYRVFKNICPLEFQHFEIYYKPSAKNKLDVPIIILDEHFNIL
jgi:predicted SprT family Zn-dependent metalloprotease